MDSRSRNSIIDSQVNELVEKIKYIDEITDESKNRIRAIISEVYDQLALGKTLDGIHFIQVSDNAYLSVSVLVNRRKAVYGIVHKNEIKLLRDKNADSNNNKQHATDIDPEGSVGNDSSIAKRKKSKSTSSKKRSSK